MQYIFNVDVYLTSFIVINLLNTYLSFTNNFVIEAKHCCHP